jgi:hypothetical protein
MQKAETAETSDRKLPTTLPLASCNNSSKTEKNRWALLFFDQSMHKASDR